MRLEFYENWLSPTGMRDGRIGLAPLGAVLSFLHREEPPVNEQIAIRAGTCAADWTFADVSGAGRWVIRRLPASMRTRAALRLIRTLVKATIRESRTKAKLSRNSGIVEIRSAAFEQLRDPASIPMRAFYAAAVKRILAHCAVDAEVGVATAHESGWNFTISVRSAKRLETIDQA